MAAAESGAGAFAGVLAAAPLGSGALFALCTALIGYGGGLFLHATLTACMRAAPAAQVGLALPRDAGGGLLALRQHLDVRLDAGGLDGAAGGGVVARRGEADGAVARDGHDGLHAALAEGLRAENQRAVSVLQGASDNL